MKKKIVKAVKPTSKLQEFVVEVPVKALSQKQARFFVFRKLYNVEFSLQK